MYLLAKLTQKKFFFVTLMRNWETFSRVIWSSYPDFQKMQQTKFKLSWRWLDGPRRSELYLFLPENNVRKWRHEIYWRESLEIIILQKHFTIQVESVEKNRFYTLEFYLWTLLIHFEFNLNRNDNVQRKLLVKFLVCPQSQFYYVFLSKLTVKFSGSKVDVPFWE